MERVDKERTEARRIIGEILKRQRKHTGLSQRAMADVVGYKNPNFLSMLEGAISNVPFDKIITVVGAYKLEPQMALVITKFLYPDCWELSKHLLKVYHERIEATGHLGENADEAVEKYYEKVIEKFHIDVGTFLESA